MEKVKIKSIKRIEPETRYDLSVEKYHNFFANGILVHNCRCITIISNEGDVSFFSREGKEFFTLDVLKKEVEKLGLSNIVLDGEICLVDENGKEDFQGIMKEIRKKDHTINNPCYMVFDFLTLDDFQRRESEASFSVRNNVLNDIIGNFETPYIKVLKQERVIDEPHFESMMAEARMNSYEGLILRKEAPYKGKRSNDLLKVKDFFDAEYVVEGVVSGNIRYILNGNEVEEEMLSSVIITHKGFKVNVGSGFSIEQRKRFFVLPEEIVGKTITVKYFEETSNQEGGVSLRFPTVKCIHGEKREV